MKPRPYQLDAKAAAHRAWEEARSILIVMATGLGKTVLATMIAQDFLPKRTMFLAHRQELIWQARDRFKELTGLSAEIEMGDYKASVDGNLFQPKSDVIISTVQTHTAGGDGGGRMTKFNPNDFGLLIIDEAHHSVSSSYRKVIDYYLQNPDLKVLGITATPDRADEEALGQVYDEFTPPYELLAAINDGWLVYPEQQFVTISSLDFTSVRTTAGDLNGADLAVVMEAEKNLQGIASATIEIAGDRRGLGFASSVAHAEMLSNIFNRHRTGMSDWICGKTDKDDRRKIVNDFAQGKIQWLWNCGCLLEGFDDSGVEIISVARPTESRSLYSQMVGRGTRPHSSIAHQLNDIGIAPFRRRMISRSQKPSLTVLDFVGNSGKHKLVCTADILGGNVSERAIENAITIARKSGKPVRMDKLAEEEEAKEQSRREEEARKSQLKAKATYSTQRIDPFDLFQIKPVVSRGWDKGKQLTEKQRNFLKRQGFNPDEMEYPRAKQLIGALISRFSENKCTFKQASILKKHGCDPNMSFDLARLTIDAIAANGWKRPDVLPTLEPVAADESDDIPF